MTRYEVFQARWNVEKLFQEACDEGMKLRVIYILKFIIYLLSSIECYFESED